MKHTPGPWLDYGQTVISSSTQHKTFLVAKCSRATDARLIAAAPELLEALLTVTIYLKMIGDPLNESMITRLEATLAKASGK
jgi:hypothetical protein